MIAEEEVRAYGTIYEPPSLHHPQQLIAIGKAAIGKNVRQTPRHLDSVERLCRLDRTLNELKFHSTKEASST
jgi:hypothetical protein